MEETMSNEIITETTPTSIPITVEREYQGPIETNVERILGMNGLSLSAPKGTIKTIQVKRDLEEQLDDVLVGHALSNKEYIIRQFKHSPCVSLSRELATPSGTLTILSAYREPFFDQTGKIVCPPNFKQRKYYTPHLTEEIEGELRARVVSVLSYPFKLLDETIVLTDCREEERNIAYIFSATIENDYPPFQFRTSAERRFNIDTDRSALIDSLMERLEEPPLYKTMKDKKVEESNVEYEFIFKSVFKLTRAFIDAAKKS